MILPPTKSFDLILTKSSAILKKKTRKLFVRPIKRTSNISVLSYRKDTTNILEEITSLELKMHRKSIPCVENCFQQVTDTVTQMPIKIQIVMVYIFI